MKNPFPKNQPDKFIPYIYKVKSKQKLNRKFDKRPREFLDVVLDRRSLTDFSEMALEELEELLYYSSKIQSIQVDDSGFLITKRTTPSAGARHPIDLLISLPDPITNRTLTYYNPIDHTLNELVISSNHLRKFFNEVNENLPIRNASIIWFSIQTSKTGSKYQNPESLYWKDTGVFLYCIQLIATYLGYKSCPVGTLAANSFDSLFNTSDILSGGGILVGK